MIKYFVLFFSAISLALAGCQPGNKNINVAATVDTTSAATESTSVQNNPVQIQLEDPDPTDTIPAGAYGINTYGKETAELVKRKLEEMFKDDLSKNLMSELSRKFIFFEYDLNDDTKKEIFVGLTGPDFCGSGGCTFLLLNSDGSLITKFTVTGYPIIIADSITKNWKDIILHSNGKNHLLKFNGKTYPSNPSIQPVYNLIPGDELPRVLDFINEPYPWFKF